MMIPEKEYIDVRFEAMEARLDTRIEAITASLTQLADSVQSLRVTVRWTAAIAIAVFAVLVSLVQWSVDARFVGLEQRFEAVRLKADTLQHSIDTLALKLETSHQRLSLLLTENQK